MSINIHTAGHAGIKCSLDLKSNCNACGDGQPSMKQEPPGTGDLVLVPT